MTASIIYTLLDKLVEEIEELVEENIQLKNELDSLKNHNKNVNLSYTSDVIDADTFIAQAFAEIQNHKWIEASLIVSKHYGENFMLKHEDNFEKLKNVMYRHLKMPTAPNRNDKSRIANEIREKRKAIRATVYTYIDRMGDYFLRHLEKTNKI
jgi:hypothetical protein